MNNLFNCALHDSISLKRVNEFKYFGVWLTYLRIWSTDVNKTVQRVSKQVGMIYKTFYQYDSQLTFLKLYLAHVDHCWSMHHSYGIHTRRL